MAITATAASPAMAGDLATPPRFAYLEWAPVIAGALGAAAISLVLFTFGSAIGLSAISPYPYSGMSAATFFIVAAIFAAIVQVGSFAAGGYLAGRMRTPWTGSLEGERHFRDGTYGFIVWALGLLIGAAIAISGASSMLRTAVQTATIGAGAAAAAGPSIARQVSMSPSDMAIDLLLRPAPPMAAPVGAAAPAAPPAAAPGVPGVPGAPTMAESREELREPLTRVFIGTLRDGSLSAPNRTYLATVVSRQTGLPQAEAEKRVDAAYAEAKNAEVQVRAAADKARKTAAVAAFLAAATLLIACAAACAGAALGGKHRDEQNAVELFGTRRFW